VIDRLTDPVIRQQKAFLAYPAMPGRVVLPSSLLFMCGIAGQYNWRSNAPVQRERLEWMAYAMRHRGPDGQGIHIDGSLGLAHRRLAIIDIEGGHQPMSTRDGTLWIAYNGEVYNYLELLDELRGLGHEPQTCCDTEAVLLAYAQWGLDFTAHLNGMWALAIWDARCRRLVLSRDRLGVKPLYYAETDDGIVFGSELKILRTVPGIANALDLDALDEYMTCGYVIRPRCLVRGARKLLPGTTLTIDCDQGVKEQSFWSLRFEPDHGPSEQDWAQQICELFTDSVRLRLRSDVPLGTLLSGGVDSTLIATTLAELKGGGAYGIDSFCTGVDLPGALQEFTWARDVANKLGLRHHEQRLTGREYGAALVDACKLLDEPLAEPMIGQLLAVCRLARQYVKVVLSGEGSDETWFGYYGYRVQYAIDFLQKFIPDQALRWVSPLLDRAAGFLPIPPKAAKYMRLVAEPLERRYLGLNYFDTTVKNSLYLPEVRDALAERDARGPMRHLYDAVDCRAWLVDNTLLRSDQMSMASGLELRVPFLDYRLVELALRVPARFKVRFHDQKVILKKALASRLPTAVAKRRKVGFPTPLAELFRSDWGREAREVLANPTRTTAHLFDRQRIMQMLDRHQSGKEEWHTQLFQMLMLEYWARGFEQPPPRPPC
jgi:asparagine synthase (glutamine-hydrolysing)